MRVRSKSRWVPALKAVAVLAILCWSLAPIVFMVMSSVKPGQDIFAVPPHWAFTPTLKHYVSLWARWQGFFHGLVNSLIITVGATVLVIVASTMAGFAYSRNRTHFFSNAALLSLSWCACCRPSWSRYHCSAWSMHCTSTTRT